MVEADLGYLTGLFAIPEVAEVWLATNEDDLREWLDPDDDTNPFVIERDGEPIGLVLYDEEHDPDYRHAGIDIVLHPDWCNQGLGTDALRTLARYLFDEVGHHRLEIDPRATNARAIASYRKVGFRDVGILRQYERGTDGEWHDGLLMDLLRDEVR